MEADLDAEKIRRILNHLDLKGRALVLVLASSGMKIREALKIELDDLNPESDPAEITIRGKYTKKRCPALYVYFKGGKGNADRLA